MRLKLRLPQRTLGSRWVVGGASPGLSSRPLGPKSHATLSHQPCHSAAHPRKQKPREPPTPPRRKMGTLASGHHFKLLLSKRQCEYEHGILGDTGVFQVLRVLRVCFFGTGSGKLFVMPVILSYIFVNTI